MLQGLSDIYDPETHTVSNSDESTAKEALKVVLQVDRRVVLELGNGDSNNRQGDAASYASNFSFDPGSVQTNSAFNKRARFDEYYYYYVT